MIFQLLHSKILGMSLLIPFERSHRCDTMKGHLNHRIRGKNIYFKEQEELMIKLRFMQECGD